MVWYGMVWCELMWGESDTEIDWPPRIRPKEVFAEWILFSAEQGSADWGLTPRLSEPDFPVGMVASESTGFPPPLSRTPSQRGALDSRRTGSSPRPLMGGSEGRPAVCHLWSQPLRLRPLRRRRLGIALGGTGRPGALSPRGHPPL